MENTSQEALVPLEQALTVFHGYEVPAIRLADDRVAPTINSLCAMLGILSHGQIQRIRRHKNLAKHLLVAIIQTAGGATEGVCSRCRSCPFLGLRSAN
jgi:hypothetical protein